MWRSRSAPLGGSERERGFASQSLGAGTPLYTLSALCFPQCRFFLQVQYNSDGTMYARKAATSPLLSNLSLTLHHSRESDIPLSCIGCLICFERPKTNVKKKKAHKTHLIDWILCHDQGEEKPICHKNDPLHLLICLMYFLSIC